MAYRELVQSLSDKLQTRLTEMLQTVEDVEALMTLPPLLQQISALEGDARKCGKGGFYAQVGSRRLQGDLGGLETSR